MPARFCTSCGQSLHTAEDHFCGGCGSPVIAGSPPSAASTSSTASTPSTVVATSAAPAPQAPRATVPPTATVGSAGSAGAAPPPFSVGTGLKSAQTAWTAVQDRVAASWPVRERHIDVGGRILPADVAVVVALDVLCSLVTLYTLKDLVFQVPSLTWAVLTGDAFTFAFGYLFLVLALVCLYVALAPLVIAWYVFRGDPVGPGLQAIVTVLLLAVAGLNGQVPGALVVFILILAALTAVLYLSPFARSYSSRIRRAGGQPGSVVLSRLLVLWTFSATGWATVCAVPGLRYVGAVGFGWVVVVLASAAGVVLAALGWRGLSRGADVTARTRVVQGAAALLVAALTSVISLGSSGMLLFANLVLLGAMVGLMWTPAAREWFTPHAPAGVATTPDPDGTTTPHAWSPQHPEHPGGAAGV